MNLSAHALSIIDSDIYSFGVKSSRGGYINEILRKYATLSKANVKATAARYATELEGLALKHRYRNAYPRDKELTFYETKKGKLTKGERQLIEELAISQAKQAFDEIAAQPRQAQITIRLQNDVYDFLTSAKNDFVSPEGQPLSSGDFIKAVIEDYAAKPYFDREAIIFNDVLETLQVAVETEIKNRPMMQIALGGSVSTLKFDVKPYKVLPDIGRNYHYLVGFSRPAGSSQGFAPASFRLSRISSALFKPKSYASGRITKAEQRAIELAIGQTGVQYLLGNPQAISIRLTPNGMNLYNVIIHGRPVFSEHLELEDGTHRLLFDCTEKQVADYFFKFGADAIVEKPSKLAEAFRDKYHAAYDSYVKAGDSTQDSSPKPQNTTSPI